MTTFADSPDIRIRHAAGVAALRLLDTEDELRRHRPRYATMVEEILEESTYPSHRGAALDALTAWGYDTTAQWHAEMTRRQTEAADRSDAAAAAAITFNTEPLL